MIFCMKLFEAITIVLYGMVGIISLIMAYKSISSKRFLLFHEKAAGTSWNNVDSRLQYVILALTRLSGLGFLVMALILLIFPIFNYFRQDEFLKYSIPLISLVFCSGLFLINYLLHKQTKSPTPWKGSLYAMGAIIVGIILSIFG